MEMGLYNQYAIYEAVIAFIKSDKSTPVLLIKFGLVVKTRSIQDEDSFVI